MQLKEVYATMPAVQTSRGEVKVSIICAIPHFTEEKNGMRKVTVKPDFAKFGTSGYYTSDSSLSKIIEKATEQKERLILRFEKQRKKGVDIDIPIDELQKDVFSAQKNIVNVCVGVYDIKNNKWILSQNYADPENDNNEIISAIATAKMGEYDEEVNPDDFFAQQQVITKTHVPNPMSFDTHQQLLTMYFFIMGLEKRYDYSLKDEIRRMFAQQLLELCDELQKLIKKADVVDHKDYSHTRARFVLFNYEEMFSNLDATNIKDFKKWKEVAYNVCSEIIVWSQNSK